MHLLRISLLTLWMCYSGVAIAAVNVLPTSGPPGRILSLTADGLSTDSVEFWITGQGSESKLADATVIRGVAGAAGTVPEYFPGDYSVEVRSRTTVQASTPFEIKGPGQLNIWPTQGPPGTLMTLSADLVGDTVSVFYDGDWILGPVPMRGESVELTVPVPQSSETGLKTVRVETSLAGAVLSYAGAEFQQTQAIGPRAPRVENVVIQREGSSNVYRGTGRLVAREGETLDTYQVSVVLALADGSSTPLDTTLDLNRITGEFQFSAEPFHPIDGDLVYAPGYSGDDENRISVGLAIIVPEDTTHGGARQSSYMLGLGTITLPDHLNATFIVKVQDLFGQPLQGAKVQLQTFLPANFEEVMKTPSGVLPAYPEFGSSEYYGPFAPFKDIPIEKCGFLLYDETINNTGELQISLDGTELPAYAFKHFTQACEFNRYDPTETSCEQSSQFFFPLVLRFSAINANHGWKVDNTWVGGAYVMLLSYDKFTNTARLFGFKYPDELDDENIHNNSFSEADMLDPENFKLLDPAVPLVFKIPPITEPLNFKLSSPLNVSGLAVERPSSKDTFTGAISLKRQGQLTTADVTSEDPMLSFVYSDIEAGLTRAEVYLEDEFQGVMTRSAESLCGDLIAGADAYRYEAPIPADRIFNLKKGEFLTGRVEARSLAGDVFVRPFQIRASREIPEWINDASAYTNRLITWKTSEVAMIADEYPKDAQVTSSNLDYEVGVLENTTSNLASVLQTMSGLTGAGEIRRFADTSNEIASRSGEDPPLSSPIVPSHGILQTGPFEETIIDTGKMPLFRYGWGIWPIASATMGADLSLRATFLYYAAISLAEMQRTVFAEPSAEIGIDVFLDVSMILDLVTASAKAASFVNISVPVLEENGEITTGECFSFNLDAIFYAKLGVCPFCLESTGVEPLIHEQAGTCLNIPQPKGAASEPPRSHPRLAFSSSGLGLLSYFAENGQLTMEESLFGQPDITYQFPATPGLMQADIAFLNDSDALVVASASALSESDFLSRQFDRINSDVSRQQRIVYAERLGRTWSEFKPLTVPTTGEASPVLATCVSGGRTSCAQAQAIAVWVRDMAGDLTAYRTQLFYALYDNGVWTAPSRVDSTLGAGDPVKDGQPTVAFWTIGTTTAPVVVWVRNTEGSLASLDQRQLMYRILDGSHTAEPVPGVPRGVASPDIIVDGNNDLAVAFTVVLPDRPFIGDQRTLYGARLRCTTQCSWEVHQKLDPAGRAYKAERPQLALDADGAANAYFRLLGYMDEFGNSANLPSDPVGVILGTGDLQEAVITAVNPEVNNPVAGGALTFDGQVNWEVTAAFDPLTGVNVAQTRGPTLGAKALNAAGSTRPRVPTRIVHGRDVPNAPVRVQRIAPGPDFAIVSVVPAGPMIPGAPLDVEVEVVNIGSPVRMQSASLSMAVTIDGRAGLRTPSIVDVVSVPMPRSTTVLSIVVPEAFEAAENHSITVSVLREGAGLADTNDENNHFTVQMGLLEPPPMVHVRSGASDYRNIVFWDGSDDPNVRGYRIYRSVHGGEPYPVGSSVFPRWVDNRNAAGGAIRYFVTTYSQGGHESPLSEPSGIAPPIDFVFASGSE